MANVVVSLPDELREMAEETLRRRSLRRAERMGEIDDMDGPVAGHGGWVAELVKVSRPQA